MKLNEYQINNQFIGDAIYTLATDSEGHRCVLLKSKGEQLVQRLKTNCMTLKTNVAMYDENENDVGKYHVIQCISQDLSINNQFSKVCQYMFSQLTKEVDTAFIVELFQDIQTLFETSADKDYHSLQIGVYGEMALIKFLRKEGRSDLAESWHSDFYTKHDIEIDANHRIEIKTTNNEKRIHSFKHNQLVRGNMEIVVASVKVEECEKGTTLYDLMIEVQKQYSDSKRKLLIDKLIKRCNISSEDKGIICDEQHVYDEIKFYKAVDVPHIDSPVPVGVTNIVYDVNLDANIPELTVSEI